MYYYYYLSHNVCTQQHYYCSYSEVALWYLRSTSKPNFVVPISPVKNPCATHDEVPMGYHQLLVCHEGNFVIPLKVAPWWPT